MNKHEAPTVTHLSSTTALHSSRASDARENEEDVLPKLPKGAVWQLGGTVLLTLRKPVVQAVNGSAGAEDVTIREVVFHPLTGAQMLRIQAAKDDAQRGLVMMQESAQLTGFTGENVFKGMDARDFVASTVIAAIFTNPGL